jgi:protein-S-isoprenylcysteine O-methyltransferase
MTRKLLTAVFAGSAIYLAPAAVNVSALHHSQLWILIATGAIVSICQPAYKPIDESAPPHDHGTAAQIVWTVYATQFLGAVESIILRYPQSFQWDIVTTIAFIAMIGGLSLRVWAVLTLGRFFTWFITIYEDHRVIRSGPFRLVRHPSYCGALILFTATLLFLHAYISALLSMVFQLWAYVRRIRYEEAMMINKFGDDYKSYASDVSALVPLVW